MYYILILFVCLYMCSFLHAQFYVDYGAGNFFLS